VAGLLEIEAFEVRRRDWAVRLPALRLDAGQVAALFAPSGAGKTTLLAALFGLLDRGDATVAGSVCWRGVPWGSLPAAERRRQLRQEIVFLAQDAPSALDPLAPIGRQIADATGAALPAVVATLQELGVEPSRQVCGRLPHQVSGGEAQRVLLAIACLRRPALVVADEPSASLDDESYAELVRQLRRLVVRGAAALLATHDGRLLRDLEARALVGTDGVFAAGTVGAEPWPASGSKTDVGTVPVLTATGVAVARAGRQVLHGVDLQLCRGEIVALVGASGAGKTTLARVLAGQLRPAAGAVVRPGRAQAVQLVPQDAFGSLTPGRSVASLVDETAANGDLDRVASRLHLDAAALARAAGQLSGGERRRAAILRAVTVRPDVLVLDEPTSGLDRATAVQVMRSVLELQRDRGMAILLITHDRELAQAVAHRVLALRGGRLCAP
jgi:peptide/nickel transport system ATP-binding protein